MRICLPWGICLWSLLVLPGCAPEQRGPERVNVYPVKGRVMVDGQPAANLRVKLHRVDQELALTTPNSSAFTDADGNFTIGTYEGDDGAPPGDYQVTFFWGQINLLNGQYGGPDKLKGKYADQESSEFVVNIIDGLPTDLGTIELTTTETE